MPPPAAVPAPTPRPSPRARGLATAVSTTVVVVAVVVAVLAVVRSLGEPGVDAWQRAGDLAWSVAPVLWALLGWLILRQLPGNTIGWLLLLPVADGITTVLDVPYAPTAPSDPDLLDLLAVWWANIGWTGVIMGLFLMASLFPTGRPAGPGWRWHTRLVLGLWAFFVVYATFASSQTSMTGTWSLDNPIGVLPGSLFDTPVFVLPWILGLLVCAVGAVASMVARFRHGTPTERQQLAWLLTPVVATGLAYVVAAAFVATADAPTTDAWGSAVPGPVGLALTLSATLIPVAITVAILRHRALDIDVLVRRTVVYALLTGLLALIYSGSVISLRAVLGRLVGADSDLVVAGSTLLVAGLFNPLRLRLHRVAVRRFSRRPYDADQVLGGLVARLRDETDLERVRDHVTVTTAAALQPQGVSLLLTAPPRSTDAAAHPVPLLPRDG